MEAIQKWDTDLFTEATAIEFRISWTEYYKGLKIMLADNQTHVLKKPSVDQTQIFVPHKEMSTPSWSYNQLPAINTLYIVNSSAPEPYVLVQHLSQGPCLLSEISRRQCLFSFLPPLGEKQPHMLNPTIHQDLGGISWWLLELRHKGSGSLRLGWLA